MPSQAEIQHVTVQVNLNLNALKIAASVFSQISNHHEHPQSTGPLTLRLPRTLKDFRESVDAVFKAAGLEKVEWE